MTLVFTTTAEEEKFYAELQKAVVENSVVSQLMQSGIVKKVSTSVVRTDGAGIWKGTAAGTLTATGSGEPARCSDQARIILLCNENKEVPPLMQAKLGKTITVTAGTYGKVTVPIQIQQNIAVSFP